MKPWVISNICPQLLTIHTSPLAHMEPHTTYVFLVIYGQESVWESKIQRFTLTTEFKGSSQQIGAMGEEISCAGFSASGQRDKEKKAHNE